MLGLALGCEVGPRSGRGLRLPEGDVDRGRAAFVELGCTQCHDVVGVSFPERDDRPEVIVRLGGEVHRIETYGELITSIIHPTRELAPGYSKEDVTEEGRSRMPSFNDEMTVAQLVDLTTFLQSHYELEREPLNMP